MNERINMVSTRNASFFRLPSSSVSSSRGLGWFRPKIMRRMTSVNQPILWRTARMPRPSDHAVKNPFALTAEHGINDVPPVKLAYRKQIERCYKKTNPTRIGKRMQHKLMPSGISPTIRGSSILNRSGSPSSI